MARKRRIFKSNLERVMTVELRFTAIGLYSSDDLIRFFTMQLDVLRNGSHAWASNENERE